MRNNNSAEWRLRSDGSGARGEFSTPTKVGRTTTPAASERVAVVTGASAGTGEATASTLAKADELGARSLALVAFGTGVGGFPIEQAAQIELAQVRAHLDAGSGLEQVVFAVRGARARAAFVAALDG